MLVLAVVLVTVLLSPPPAAAWGFEAHKLIADRAIDLLPPELKAAFEKHRGFIIERSIDPDLWRSAGWEDEPPNHFVDIDHAAFGPYPFDGLPRDYSAAVQKFGKAFIDQQGRLPWRVQEFYGKLQREFESLTRQPAPAYAMDNIVFYSAILAHYVADGYVPLHSSVNYDGQLTGQVGVHSRWEADLFERNRATIRIAPAAPKGVTNPRDFVFDTLLSGSRLVAGVLDADKTAAAAREFYDDAYYEAFAKGALPGLERRLNESMTGVASIIIGAWERAGRPALPAPTARTPRPIPRPTP